MKAFQHVVATVVAIALCVSMAFAGNIYVDASNDTEPWEGTLSNPYQTLTQAILLGTFASGDVILVAPGAYDVALGESFPLTVPNGVIVRGGASLQASWPRIGGDINSDTVKELFLIDATGSDLADIQLDRLIFSR